MSLTPYIVTVAASGAVASASTETFTIPTRGRSGIIVVIDPTAVTGGASITPTIKGYDSVSGKTWDLLVGAAISGTGTVVLQVAPNLAAVTNLAAAKLLPSTVILSIAHADNKSYTRSIAAHLVG
jgi:hypothetical protein